MPKLLDLRPLAPGQLREHLLPAAVRDGPGRLRDVTQHREGACGAPRDHPELHRREVLRLVDDHVAELRRRAMEDRARLVDHGEVVVAPPAPGAA